MMPAPPPPPPPTPTPMKPIRIGGDIEQPTLLHRVSPEYPQIAISAKKEGIVILVPNRSSSLLPSVFTCSNVVRRLKSPRRDDAALSI